MAHRILPLTALTLTLFAAGCAADSVDDGANDEAAETAAGATVLKSDGTTASTGLTVTSSIEKRGTARTEYLTLKRGSSKAKLTCTSVVTVDDDGTGLLGSDCAYTSQPDFSPGVNECRINVNVELPAKTLKPLQVLCRNPGKISESQKQLLSIVFGATPYQTVPDQTFSSSTGEVAGATEVPMTLVQLGTSTDKDSYALMQYLGDAAKPLFGKTQTLTYGHALPAPAEQPINRVSVFLEDLPKGSVALNVMGGNRTLSVSSGIPLFDANGELASKGDLTASFAASVGAQ